MNTDRKKSNLSLDGERGLPNVNTSKPSTRKRGLTRVFVWGGLLATLGFVYMHYVKSQHDKTEDASKYMQLTNAVPARTFELPLDNTTPQTGANLSDQQSNTSQPQQSDIPANLLALLDKSGAELMVSKENKEPAETPAMPMADVNPHSQGALGGMLNATPTPLHTASVLKNRDYLLAKGSFIDCVLQTRLDSTVPGMTSCVVTRPIYSDTGKVLLVERGSTVSGEYQANVKQGQARIFVLWSRIKTPNGVVINLDSPGTDALGGAGVPGYVDNHFWQRFGGAIMLSLVQDFAAALSNSIDKTGTTITLNNTSDASQSLATEALRNTINIPPTLYKNQGERIGIYVARDLDFKSVYDLKPE